MTPKEKAKELHLRFLLKLPFNKEVITENEHGNWSYDSEQLAQEHALIAVDEIIVQFRNIMFPSPSIEQGIKFWQSVKTEILAL